MLLLVVYLKLCRSRSRLLGPSLSEIKRIQFVGPAGAGKSTLAKLMAKRLDANYIRLDDFKISLPGWRTNQRAEFEQCVQQEKSLAKRFVIDGNYHTLGNEQLTRDVDLIIWLDYSFWLVSFRLCKRAISRGEFYGWKMLLIPFAWILLIQQYLTNRARRSQYLSDLRSCQIPCAWITSPDDVEHVLNGLI